MEILHVPLRHFMETHQRHLSSTLTIPSILYSLMSISSTPFTSVHSQTLLTFWASSPSTTYYTKLPILYCLLNICWRLITDIMLQHYTILFPNLLFTHILFISFTSIHFPTVLAFWAISTSPVYNTVWAICIYHLNTRAISITDISLQHSPFHIQTFYLHILYSSPSLLSTSDLDSILGALDTKHISNTTITAHFLHTLHFTPITPFSITTTLLYHSLTTHHLHHHQHQHSPSLTNTLTIHIYTPYTYCNSKLLQKKYTSPRFEHHTSHPSR